MIRRFSRISIDELEAAFDRKRADPNFLGKLVDELSHRSTSRAAELKVRATQALGTGHGTSSRTRHSAQASAASPGPGVSAPHPASAPPGAAARSAQRGPMPPISDLPTAVLSAWTALEVLSPPSFRRPEDRAGGDRSAVARLDGGRLPWEPPGQKARPNTRLYYQVVLGVIDLDAAVTRLLRVFADARPERPAARGRAVLAVVIVDRHGRPVDQAAATAVSSFGWGVPRALAGDLDGLAGWPVAERTL